MQIKSITQLNDIKFDEISGSLSSNTPSYIELSYQYNNVYNSYKFEFNKFFNWICDKFNKIHADLLQFEDLRNLIAQVSNELSDGVDNKLENYVYLTSNNPADIQTISTPKIFANNLTVGQENTEYSLNVKNKANFENDVGFNTLTANAITAENEIIAGNITVENLTCTAEIADLSAKCAYWG